MAENGQPLEKVVLVRMMRLNASVQGIVMGTLLGLGVFVATNWLVLKGGDVVGPHLVLLSQFFIGYRVTFLGSLVGLIYGFIVGFVVGFFMAQAYNWFVDLRHGKQRDGI